MSNIINACRNYGAYPYQCKSSYPDSDAQRNLEDRTHYCDPDTLKHFKARILRGTHSSNGLFYLLQESLAHPGMGRVRRNVLFDVFGDVVREQTSRETFHKTAAKADAEYSNLRAWMDDDANAATIEITLRAKINSDRSRLDDVIRALDKVEV